jgi:hypothetical protein
MVCFASQTEFLVTPGKRVGKESIMRMSREEFGGRLESQSRSALCGMMNAAQTFERIRLALALTAEIRGCGSFQIPRLASGKNSGENLPLSVRISYRNDRLYSLTHA